jgi:hypothetical protein
MEALLIALAKKYGMAKAMQILGLDKQTQNPKYAISLGGKTLDLGSMATRAGINSLMSGNLGGMLGPAALMGGAFMLGKAFDPLNPNSQNYSPNLAGQIDYLSGRNNFIGTNPNSGLMQYGPESVLRGQNVSSMFGTNNYQTQLQNKIDWFEDRIDKGKNYNEEMYEKALEEKKDLFEYRADIRDKAKTKSSKPSYQGPTGKDIHGGNGSSSNNQSSSKSSGSGHSGSGYQGASGSHHYRRGGIASL